MYSGCTLKLADKPKIYDYCICIYSTWLTYNLNTNRPKFIKDGNFYLQTSKIKIFLSNISTKMSRIKMGEYLSLFGVLKLSTSLTLALQFLFKKCLLQITTDDYKLQMIRGIPLFFCWLWSWYFWQETEHQLDLGMHSTQ